MQTKTLMDRKTLLSKPITKKDLAQMKLLTTASISYKLLHIFRRHIGEYNAISHNELFRKVFGRSEEITLADDLRWEYVKRAMHFCRQRTKCFIGHKYEHGVWKYFVVEDFKDAKYFCNTLEKNIGRMRAMQQKAMKSIRQKWSKIDWVEDSQKIFALEKWKKQKLIS